MAFFLGSSVLATATLNAQAVKDQIKTTILAHSNWSFVEETTFNTTYPTDVYKCSSVGNGLGADFYLAVMWNAANILCFDLAEGYNIATHKPQRPVVSGALAAITLQADGGIMPVGTEIDWFVGTNNGRTVWHPLYTISGGAMDYYIGVAADAFYMMVRSATGQAAYLGAYESLVPTSATNDPLPLVCAGKGMFDQNGALTMGEVSFNRHPMRGGLSTPYACTGGGQDGIETNMAYSWDVPYAIQVKGFSVGTGLVGSDHQDLYRSGGYAAKMLLTNAFTFNSATAGRDKTGWIRGKLKHFRYVQGSGTAFGDTVSVDGVTYINTGNTSYPSHWFEKDPA